MSEKVISRWWECQKRLEEVFKELQAKEERIGELSENLKLERRMASESFSKALERDKELLEKISSLEARLAEAAEALEILSAFAKNHCTSISATNAIFSSMRKSTCRA